MTIAADRHDRHVILYEETSISSSVQPILRVQYDDKLALPLSLCLNYRVGSMLNTGPLYGPLPQFTGLLYGYE